ncbi:MULTISPECIES: hypothetical protein [Methylococcus]|uniref:hypothetical protein n=1 Tax=Methylococcus TaxID=413 RepID=UPI0018DF0032|nr:MULTISPECIES: hypothetical protein [Methylococcus]MDF9392794.1 hypothetical protein [Methylococcus capsulatus]
MNPHNIRIAIIGLGYVGLPVAVQFGKHFSIIGFDLKQAGIDILEQSRAGQYDAIVLTVAHDEFRQQVAAAIRATAVPSPCCTMSNTCFRHIGSTNGCEDRYPVS